MKYNSLQKIIIITIFFIFILFFVDKFLMFTNINNIKNDKFYTIENDKIPSIYNVVGKRKLYSYKSYKKNDIYTNIYRYKNVKDVKSDLSKYISELKNNYNYIYTSDINLNNDSDLISLSTYSIDNNCIIIVKISYSDNNYEIKISKGKGNIKVFE